MSSFSRQDAQVLRKLLQDATIKCSDRCLYQSAKWAAELAASLSKHFADEDGPGDVDLDAEDSVSLPSGISSDPKEAKLEAIEFQRYLQAKAYFDCREFDRCSSVFLKASFSQHSPSKTSTPLKSSPWRATARVSAGSGPSITAKHQPNEVSQLSQKALFLSLYAKYMAGEKRKDEENEMILGPADRGSAVNKELASITRVLGSYFGSRKPNQHSSGWLEYLYGVVLAKGKNEDEAKHWLIRSILIYPYNWGTWLELNDMIGSGDELQEIFNELEPNVIAIIFNIFANQELYQATEQVHRQLTELEHVFPGSAFLQTQRALLFYHSKDFDDAETIFSNILSAEPHRLDSLDHYSNILYVMGSRPKLAFVAQLANATDKFRPETCCVIGNYYSLKSEHEKAVQYFRRALQLDRTFLSAWTLMGHEFVEMKNTHAAIESYRRAVDVNRKDYRAWYGLGQTYEVLEMHLYALFYFQRAAALRPYDSKMWHAVGSCYDRVGRPMQSIKAYKRALVAGSYFDAGSSFASAGSAAPDAYTVVETLHSIAQMYEKLGDREQAAQYMEMTLAQEDGLANAEEEDPDDELRGPGTGVTTTTSKARMWLARWEAQSGGFARAMELAHELCQDGIEVEEAKALIRDIRARMDAPSG